MGTLLISALFPTLAFEALLFGLAFGYFAADVWGFWRSQESNKWKVGDLVQIMVRDSTIYFAMYVYPSNRSLDESNLMVPVMSQLLPWTLETLNLLRR
jgi:hypothetical protein